MLSLSVDLSDFSGKKSEFNSVYNGELPTRRTFLSGMCTTRFPQNKYGELRLTNFYFLKSKRRYSRDECIYDSIVFLQSAIIVPKWLF